MKSVSVSFGEVPFQIKSTAVLCGEDLVIAVTGGTLPHVGAVSLAVYEPVRDSATVSTISVFTHRDNQLSASCAGKMAKALKCTVTVSVGIHVDHAGTEELEKLCMNFEECTSRLTEHLKTVLVKEKE